MRELPRIQFVRLTDRQPELSYDEIRAASGRTVRQYRLPPSEPDQFVYTDTPHIKSRAFIEQIGPYLETRYMQRTEMDMRDRFNRQRDFHAGFVEGYSVFDHIGEEQSFNTLLPMARVGVFMDKYPGLKQLAMTYRGVKSWAKRRGPR